MTQIFHECSNLSHGWIQLNIDDTFEYVVDHEFVTQEAFEDVFGTKEKPKSNGCPACDFIRGIGGCGR